MHGDHRYRINQPRVIFENIDGELILLNMEKGCYFTTDQVGADAWALIESGHSVSEMLEAVQFLYDGDPAEMAKALAAFLKRLEQEELVTLDDSRRENVASSLAMDPKRLPFRSPFRPPDLQKYSDMKDMLMLDPVHDVEAAGWPAPKGEES